jgi:hypothetical protein
LVIKVRAKTSPKTSPRLRYGDNPLLVFVGTGVVEIEGTVGLGTFVGKAGNPLDGPPTV